MSRALGKQSLGGPQLSGGGYPLSVLHGPKWGFEDFGADGPWLMLPQDETRTLMLNIDPGAPVKLYPVNSHGFAARRNLVTAPMVLRAILRGHQLELSGTAPWDGFALDVFQPSRQLRVWVSVKARRTVPLVVHYVEHGPGMAVRTTREELRRMVDRANQILFPQSNVRLTIAMESVLTHERIGKHLGGTVLTNPGEKGDEWVPLSQHKRTIPTGASDLPSLNLFLVRKTEQQLNSGLTDVLASTADGMCVFEDHYFNGEFFTDQASVTLAHEVGHHLGLHHHGSHVFQHPNHLMNPENKGGTTLTREEIDSINPGPSVKADPMDLDPTRFPNAESGVYA